MFRKCVVVAVVLTCLAAWPAAALAGGGGHAIKTFGPGSPGLGDPYFPFDGNGGYDVKHYDLAIAYDPPTDVLRGVATITRAGHAEPLELQPRLQRAHDPLDQG